MAPVDSPSGIEGKSGHREHEAEQQNRAADPIWVSANAARDAARYTRGLLFVGAIVLLVGFATLGAAVWAVQLDKRAALEALKGAEPERKRLAREKSVSVGVDCGGGVTHTKKN